jgi:hypothetical protein
MLKAIGRFPEAQFGFCIVVLCRGKLEGQDFFAFVAIEPQNFSHFETHYEPGVLANFRPFGRELLRGWGKIPSKEILEFVTHKHDLEFDVEPHFLERLIAVTHLHQPSPFPLKPAMASGS